MQAVILAAGKGKRLLPLTSQMSKGLLPIAGKSMITRILESHQICGISEVVLVASNEDNLIKRYFEQNPVPGVKIKFAYQERPLGMANALASAASLIQGDFLLSACDSLIPLPSMIEFCQLWRTESNLGALLALMQIVPEQACASSVVQLRECWVERIIEKPKDDQIISTISSLPFYLFSRRILDLLPEIQLSSRGEYELQDAIQALIDHAERVRGFMIPTRYNLTSLTDYLDLNLQFLENEQPQYIHSSCQLGFKVQLIAPYFIEEGTVIEEGCCVGPHVYLRNRCRIGKNSHLSKCVVNSFASVEPDSLFTFRLVNPETE